MKRVLLGILCFTFLSSLNAQQIHEIDYDQPGIDNSEFVEVRLPSSDNPSHFRVTLYNGATDASYDSFILSDADVTCTTVGPFQYCVWDPSGNDNLQNGAPDGLSLYNVNTFTLIEFLSYEGTFTASGGDADGVLSVNIGVSETNSTAANMSLQREEDGTNWFGPSASTPGGPNELPMPVALTSFIAKQTEANSVALTWSTESEENNKYFSIEHSVNGRDFVEVGQVAGAGTTYEARHYQFIHQEVERGSNYYRLRQVDFDGTYSFSEIEVVILEEQSELSIYPTLVQEEILISFSEALEDDGTIEIVNWLGQVVLSDQIAEKNEKFNFNVSGLEKGHYIVRVYTGNQIKSSRFVKM